MITANFGSNIRLVGDSINNPNPLDPKIQNQFQGLYDKISKSPNNAEHLILKANWITGVELEKLADILVPYSNLQFLSLNYNTINAAAMPYLKKIILDHPLLVEIDLSHNELTDLDIQALLEENTDELNLRLKSITFTLMNNKISESGLKQVIGKLSFDSCISILGYNMLGEELEAYYYDQMTLGTPVNQPNHSGDANTKDKSSNDASFLARSPMTTSFDVLKVATVETPKSKLDDQKQLNSPALLHSSGISGKKEPKDEKIPTPEAKTPPAITISPKKL